MVKNKTRMLLGLACVAAAAGVGVTAYATVSALAVEPAGVAAVEGDSLATLDVKWSGQSQYGPHDAVGTDGSEWSVTCGQTRFTGSNDDGKNYNKLVLGNLITIDGIGADEKYYSAVICETPVVNAGAFDYSFSTGMGSVSNISLVSSTDRNGTFTEVNLTSGSQGQNSESGRFEFETITESTYFALILHNSSGYFRADNLTASIFEGAIAGTPEDAKPVSLEISREEGKQSYYVDSVFNKAGYEVVLNYGSATDPSYSATSILDVDDSRLTWNYDLTTVGEDKELTVTFVEGDVELTSNALTYDVLVDPMTHAISDTLTADDLAATGTSYTAFSNVKKDTETVYAGNSATDHGAIQLRSSKSSSGIVMTSSVSKAVGIELTFNSSTTSGRVVSVYGQSTAYSSASELYGGSSPIAEIAYSDGAKNQLIVFDQPYDYIGIRSKSGALYLDEVTFYFEAPEPSQAESYAETFIKSMTCDGKGAITAAEGTWETLSVQYADLSESDKEILKKATPDENSESWVGQAVARYDYIVGKYGVEQYPDFMGRTPARIPEARSVDVNDQTAAWVIAGISAAGIASAAAFFFLRRRKEA